MQSTPPSRDVYSVSRLNAEIRAVLEGSFPLVWVEGEISNLAQPRSGHSYFSLKDAHAQVRCALFRNRRRLLRFQPREGDRVVVWARVSLYEARGDFQLIVEQMEPAGEGELLRAFQELKAKLEKEGLFDSGRKKPIPPFPRCVGVVTSPTGAAIRDILQVMRRRWPGLPVILYPTRVQGEEAPREIVEALRLADARGECDLIILARGGGSLEDLSAFNDERLARTIAQLETPLISAIGHETDFTIADFVADRRAPTPSAAAELATPDRDEVRDRLGRQARRLARAIGQQLQKERSRLEHTAHKLHLLHPRRRMEQQQQKVDELSQRLEREIRQLLQRRRQRLQLAQERLRAHGPTAKMALLTRDLESGRRRLRDAIGNRLARERERLALLSRTLNGVSPLQTLARGYSITSDARSGEILTRADQVKPGTPIHTRLAKGTLLSVVEEIQPDDGD